MNPAQALAHLRAHPRTFLDKHYVKIEVNTTQPSGTANFLFGATSDRAGVADPFDRTRGTAFLGGLGGLFKGTKTFKFTAMAFRLLPGHVPCQVEVVAVTSSTGLNFGALPITRLGQHGGADVMVTTLLNGCTFVISPDGNDVICAHIKPEVGELSALEVAQQVRHHGGFAGHPGALTPFGQGVGYDEGHQDVSILGVRRNGRWKIYAQIHDRHQFNVTRVRRIFEG